MPEYILEIEGKGGFLPYKRRTKAKNILEAAITFLNRDYALKARYMVTDIINKIREA